ncbi:MAG: aldehyde ferredoxin oxidoreductase family protein [Anaerolineae bacterium]
MGGFQGRVLHVDLSSGHIWSETLGMDTIQSYLGSRGVNADILWRSLKPGTKPLGPDNVLIFGTGTLTGTRAPSSGRTTVTCKSPATGLYLKTSAGGRWGATLKFAGYDNLIVHGCAARPVYIDIDEERVRIMPADHLWGLDVRETTRALQEEAGDRKIEVACIGPAGENLVKMAALMMSTYSAAGRGGAGAVMGSKNLKAVVASGRRRVKVHDRARLDYWIEKVREGLANAPSARQKTLYGTSGSMVALNELRVLPTMNFQRGYFEDAYKLSGQYLVEAGYLKRRMSCYSCPVACHRYTEVDEGDYAGSYSGGPEYETLAVFGAGCGIHDTEVVLKANELCNIYGLDTISTGSVIQWFIESNLRGVLSEDQRDGLNPEWGDAETVLELIRRIAYRQGVGDLLAEGVRAAASEVGRGSEKWAVEAKGLEQSRVETRSAKAYALAFAVNPRGPDHLHAQPIAEFGIRPLGVDLIERITGSREYANPYITDKRAEIVVYHEDWYAAVDSLGLCSFPTTADFAISPEIMAGLLSAAVGADFTEEEMLRAGRRIITLEKCFNVREGATRADDRLPWRLMHEENPDREGAINSPEEMNRMLDEYYALHGWDLKTSWPTRQTLESLSLSHVADELARLGRLP